MNEVTKQTDFDYSLVGNETAHRLMALSNQLDGIYQNYSIAVGEVLYKAQQELASYGDGTFQNWVASKKISKSNAYNYINSYKFIQQLDEPEEREIFISQPQRVKNEMSKPSANPKVNQAVFDGDITTHKEYKELERQLKLAEADNTRLKQQNENLAEQALANLGKTVTKEVVKEVVPDDYKATKQLNNSLLDKNKELSSELEHAQDSAEYYRQQLEELQNERLAVNEKSAKYEELTRAIEASRGQLNAEQAKISSHKNLVAYLRKGNELLTSMGGIIYLNDEAYLKSNNQLLNEFNLLKDGINRLADELNRMTSQADIIEGDIL